MKFCLNSRQDKTYRNKADILYMEYRDIKALADDLEEFPDKDIILDIPDTEDVDWEEIKQCNILSQGHLIGCVHNLMKDGQKCKNMNMRFYWGFPIETFYDLNAVKDFGVEYVRLDAPLFFQMDKVKRTGIKVIAVPNIAYAAYVPRENGIHGTWIRPEDLHLYDDYIDIIMFEDCAEMRKERTLYDIYAERHEWPGPLNMLITNFDYEATNRMIYPTTMTKCRLFCGQKCEQGRPCRICDRTMWLANPDRIREYQDAMNQT